MSMKITEKVLSIPPYLSTSWSRIMALHVKANILTITLSDGETVNIPNLDSATLDAIFQHHALYLEKETSQQEKSSKFQGAADPEEPSIRLAFGAPLEGLGSVMQHNPNQANSPDIPPEVLNKIGAIARIIASTEDQLSIPKAEPNCNCFHCQIARALKPDSSVKEQEEPVVTSEELQFQQWTIIQAGDKLFTVVNRLDDHEKYQVFLGEPVGCTCGKVGCEHILAVLKS